MSSLSQTFYSAGLGCASATCACALINIVPALMAILFRQERARIISLAVKAKLVGAVICMIVNGYKSVSVTAVHIVLILRSARPSQDLKLQQKRPIPFGVRVQNSRHQIAFVMIVLMISITVAPMAAASTVKNTEVASSADEGVGVGDKLPPNCHSVPQCTDDCFPCYESGRHSFCCES